MTQIDHYGILIDHYWIIYPLGRDHYQPIVKWLILYTMNFSSGDFSLISNGAFLIKNGAIATSLEKVTFSKNLFDILKNIRIVGTDICRNTGSCDVSTVVINDIKFSS